MSGLFVTGTDTGVGKTVLTAAICAALVARGERVVAHKPAVTGLDEPPDREWGRDHELLASITGQEPGDVTPHAFGLAAAPHLAAATEPLDPAALVARARGATLVEGVGGLLVPLAPGFSVRDLAVELGHPVVVAARAGLGTINHTLLTLEAARAQGLRVAGAVLGPWPARPSTLEESNRETIAELGAVQVAVLPRIRRAELAQAGEQLPIDSWRE